MKKIAKHLIYFLHFTIAAEITAQKLKARATPSKPLAPAKGQQ
jgi:hypothetical protein